MCALLLLVWLAMNAGEGWAPGVRRLVAMHESEGFLGVIYLDLFRRPNKFPSAAHFTLRCGRQLADGTYQVGLLVGRWGPIGVKAVVVQDLQFSNAQFGAHMGLPIQIK